MMNHKRLKQIMIVSFIMLLLCFVFLFKSCSHGLDKIEKAIRLMEECIGDTVVIENDTLIIINYSTISDSYTLSNGMEVNPKIVEEFLMPE